MSEQKPQLLKYEELLLAHSGYTRVLDGFQLAQSGFETIVESKIFKDMPEEQKRIYHEIHRMIELSKNFARAKGALLQSVKNIDALGEQIIKDQGV